MTVSSTPEESVLSAETIAVGLMSYVVLLLALVMSGALWTALSPVHEAIVGLLYSLVR